MNFSVDTNIWQLAGWTMIHFAWTGALLFALTFLIRLVLRRAHPTWRYATTLTLFAALALSPLAIAGYLAATWPERSTPVAHATPSAEESVAPLQPKPAEPSPVALPPETIELTELDDTQLEALAAPPQDSPIIELTDHPEFTDPSTEPLATETSPEPATHEPPPIATGTEPTPGVTPSSSALSVGSVVNPTRAEQLIATLDRASQYLPWLWLIGAPLTFALLATGLVGGERLRRSAELLTTGPIVEACDALKKQLNITRRVAVAVTDRVAQPVLVGIVRPMILLPWAALHGWRADQIEMVLVHELAHVRRWDNLVNLGQRVVESLLFYHPAVWLVSRWLRHDREECCDAVVVAQTGEPAEYANLLIAVASQLKPRRSLLAASAMAQHPLTRRIRRLLQMEESPMLVSRTSLLLGVAALMVAAVVAANYPLWAEDERPAQEQEGTQDAENTKQAADANKPSQQRLKCEWGNTVYTLERLTHGTNEGKVELRSMSKSPLADFATKEAVGSPRIDVQKVVRATKVENVSTIIAESITVTLPDGTVYAMGDDATVDDTQETAESNSPFLSLEDQRVADLAYNTLQVEVEPLDEALLAAVKEQKFEGGVKVVSSASPQGEGRGGWGRSFFQPGDILVGIHVWPVTDFKSLGDTLRREDLYEFPTLKMYVLRQMPVPYDPNAEGEGGFGPGLGPDGALPATVPMEWQLQTGRVTFDMQAWQIEQSRIGNAGQEAISEERRRAEEREREQEQAERASRPPHDEQNDKRSQLRYKGRSFDQWRTEWRNELDVDERIEAIKALTSFGNAGYGGEAAEAIMEVAAKLKLVEILGAQNSESPDYKLGTALRQAFSSSGIPPSDWVPELIKRYDDQPEGFARLWNQLLQRAPTDPALPLEPVLEFAERRDPLLEGQEIKLLLIADPDIKTPEVEAFIRESIMHDDLGVRIRALEVLSIDPNKPYRPNENTLQAMKKFVPELITNLMHDDLAVTRKAAGAISHPETRTAIVSELRQMFEGSKVPPSVPGDPEGPESGALAARVAALRALGRVYVDDEETTQALLKLAGSEPDELARAAAVVLDILDNGMYDGSRRDGYERLLDRLVDERSRAEEEDKAALRAKLIKEIGPQMDAEAAAIDPYYDVAAKISEEGDYVQPQRPGFAQGFQEKPTTDPLSPAEPMQGTAPPSLQKSPKTPEPTTEIADAPNVAEAANTTPPDRVRYQGRSFDEWRAQWQNELDVAQRTEAIKALTAFARAGFGREAADAILEVAAQYNMAISDGNSPEFLLVQAIKSSLEHSYSSGGIPAEVWMSVLKERLEADPKTFKRLVVAMLPVANLTEWTRPIVDEFSRSEDKEIRRAAFELYFYHVDSIEIEVDEEVRRALAHEDPTVVTYAIKSMVRYQSVDRGTPPRVIALPIVERLRPEVLETLFHREEAARQFARWLIASTDDSLARRFAQDLVKRLEQSKGDTPEATDTRIAAIRAIGALGPRAKSAMESLEDPKSLFAGDDLPTRAAMAAAMYQILGRSDAGDREKMGKLGPVWDAMNEGLDSSASEQLAQTFSNEVTEIYPEEQMPTAVKEIFGYLFEKGEAPSKKE